jgi:hypothetical protein
VASPLLIGTIGRGNTGNLTVSSTRDALRAAKQIISYFLRNPRAADTLEGIARWRLLEEHIHQSVRLTQRALQTLVAMGLVVARHTESSGTIYYLDKSKCEEAERFLSGDAGQKKSPRRKKRKRN